MTFNTISVIGLGYIGLPTAAMFASKGKQVIGVDVNQHVVDTINSGKIHIVEPYLDVIVGEAIKNGFLKASGSPEPADAFLIAVPTPFLPVQFEGSIPQPDLSYVEHAAKAIAEVLKKGDLVILESTSPVGATEQMAKWLAEKRPDLTFPADNGDASDIRIAYCPERVLPGQVVRELVDNDRVIGGLSKSCSDAAVDLYKVFVEGDCVVTNARTAEMVKLTENASRDVGIAFANELSVICDTLEINVWELISIANRHPRVNILQPGPGVGGHCIAVDPWFIVSKSPDDANLIGMARKVNDSKPRWVIKKVEAAIADYLKSNPSKAEADVTIALYGLSFKPNIDDLRESPACKIAVDLAGRFQGKLLCVEPHIDKLPSSLPSSELVEVGEGLAKAHIHLMLVAHTLFKDYVPPNGIVIDTTGVWVGNRLT